MKKETIQHDPHLNKNAISIIKQPDGNYIGEMWKGDKFVTARQGDPHTVLEMLITHDGN